MQALEELIDHLEDVLDDGWAGFTGRVVDKGEIRAQAAVEEAGGVRTTDNVGSADGAAIFTAIGLPDPGPVTVLTLPMQVAQKLHACTAPDTDGWINDRAHDLVDLQLIALDLDASQLPEVRAACEQLFRVRSGHDWPPAVTARDGWPDRYDEERADVRADVRETLEQAVDWANEFIGRIAVA